jgi:flavin reductase (DIM6/NTAB) family NADH-FMN oxidoreductase RutF
MELPDKIFEIFDKGWPILTAGNKDSFNMMTISWGEMGTLWGKPVVSVFVRESRYTHEFMDKEEYFTLSFVNTRWRREQLMLLGSKSGRDIDKLKESGFKLFERPHGLSYTDAELILVCKKLFKQQIDMDKMPEDIRNKFYKSGDPHDMYIGEVVEVLSDYYNGKSSNSLIKTGEGSGISSSRWAVCMSKSNSTYSAELYFMGAGGAHQRLYEIDKDVFDQAGTFEDDDYKTENLIKEKGRLLYEAADERQTLPWQNISDDYYKIICNWTNIMGEKED